jgi:hypothetical protein
LEGKQERGAIMLEKAIQSLVLCISVVLILFVIARAQNIDTTAKNGSDTLHITGNPPYMPTISDEEIRLMDSAVAAYKEARTYRLASSRTPRHPLEVLRAVHPGDEKIVSEIAYNAPPAPKKIKIRKRFFASLFSGTKKEPTETQTISGW